MEEGELLLLPNLVMVVDEHGIFHSSIGGKINWGNGLKLIKLRTSG